MSLQQRVRTDALLLCESRATSSSAFAALHPVRHNTRVLAAALVGTSVEFYDFFIYATAAALVFGVLFFPSHSTVIQTLLAFMSFGVAFFARPEGAIVFGHFGDRIGRRASLVASLLLWVRARF